MIALLLLATAQAATISVGEAPPAPEEVLRGEMRVVVVDGRDDPTERGATVSGGADPTVLSGSLTGRVARLVGGSAHAEGAWVGAEGPELNVRILGLSCEGVRGPTCTLELQLSWDAGEPTTLSATGAGTGGLSEALAMTFAHAAARVRTFLQADATFAAALAHPRSAPPLRDVQLLRWTEDGVSRHAEVLDAADGAHCVADPEPRWIVDGRVESLGIRAAPDRRWAVAWLPDSTLIAGAWEAQTDDAFVIDTGTRRRVLRFDRLADRFVSGPPKQDCAEALVPAPARALVLSDHLGHPLRAIHLDLPRDVVASTPIRSRWSDAPDLTLSADAFADATDDATIRARLAEVRDRLDRARQQGHVLTGVGGGILAVSAGLTLFSLVGSTVQGGIPPEHAQYGTAASIALPLGVIGGPILAGGIHRDLEARKRRAALDAGALDELRSPRDVWLAAEKAE